MNAIGFDFTTLAVLWLTASLVMIPLLVLAVRFAVASVAMLVVAMANPLPVQSSMHAS